MNEVTSKDGTTIAFDRLGDGPPVILVCGGSTDRMANAPLAAPWHRGSPCSTTTVGVEATAGTRRPMRSSGRSRTSLP